MTTTGLRTIDEHKRTYGVKEGLEGNVGPFIEDSDSDSECEPLENFKGTICRQCGEDIDWKNEDFFVEHPADKTKILCGGCHETSECRNLSTMMAIAFLS